MTEDDLLKQLAAPEPSLGVGLWAAQVSGPRTTRAVVETHRPFGGDLARWLQRLAREPLGQADPVDDERIARKILRTMRDARSGHKGTYDAMTSCLEAAEDLDDPLAVALIATMAGDEAATLGRFDDADALADRALGAFEDPRVAALALSIQSNTAVQRGLPQVARTLARRAQEQAGAGSVASAITHMRAVVVAHFVGESCIETLEAAIADFEAAGARQKLDQARLYLAHVTLAPGRFREAIVHVRQVTAADPFVRAYSKAIEGCALLGMGRIRLARRALEAAVEGLPAGEQQRWLAAAAALAAARLEGTETLESQALAEGLPDPLPEDAPGTVVLLRLTHRWAQGYAPARIFERARVLDDVESLCAAAGYRADRAFQIGAIGEALGWLDEADEAARRGGFLHRALRNRWARLRIAVVRAEDCRDALQSTLEAFVSHGDVFGEARTSALLGEALLSEQPVEAARPLRRAVSLADSFGWTWGTGRWRWLLALLGDPVPGAAPATVDERILHAGLGVLGADGDVPSAVLGLDTARAGLPDTERRRHLERLVCAALERGGWRWRPAGAQTLVFREAGREVWLDGQQIAKMGRARIQFRLLQALVTGDFADREALFSEVWEQPYRAPSSDNTLHVALGRLRGRLGDAVTIQVDERGEVTLEPALGALVQHPG